MVYKPRHQAQLDPAVPTRAVDCGVRATSVAIDKVTKGLKAPKVSIIRNRGNMGVTATNVHEWQRAIESYDTPKELGGKYERIRTEAVVGGKFDTVREFMKEVRDGAVIAAVHYGALRRIAPRKTGSLSFAGYHALLLAQDKFDDDSQWLDYDSLNDGRYSGCPKGPVWLPRSKAKTAMEAVGKKEAGDASVWALLVYPADRIGDTPVPPPVEPKPEVQPLSAILADFYEYRDELTDPDRVDRFQTMIDAFELTLGVSLDPDEHDTAEDGVKEA